MAVKKPLPAPKVSLVNGEMVIAVSSFVLTLSTAVSFTAVMLIMTESVSAKRITPSSSVRMLILPTPVPVPAILAKLLVLAVGVNLRPFNAALMFATVPVMRMVASFVPVLTAVSGAPVPELFVVTLNVKPAVLANVSKPFSAQMVTVSMPPLGSLT